MKHKRILLGIYKENCHVVYSFFGIKLKIRKGTQNYKKQRISDAYWLFREDDKVTTKQKVWYLSNLFYDRVGYYPDFREPKTFNEKLSWMKLNYYNPVENRCVDKYEFKNYIKEKLGDGYTIPLIGVYEDANDIDFDSLPDKFVIKTTTNGAAVGVKVIRDKSAIDIDSVKYVFNNLIQEWNKTYYTILARGYKEVTPRIIIEEYVEQPNGQLYDFKFHCFHGEPKLVLGVKDRKHGEYRFGFYDTDWNRINLHRGNESLMVDVDKPKHYDKMLEIAKFLSKDFPFVRVDFYEVGDKIYVGELTFTPKGAFGIYEPKEWDYKMGEWLDLNKLNPEYLHILPEFKESAKKFLDSSKIEECMAV